MCLFCDSDDGLAWNPWAKDDDLFDRADDIRDRDREGA